MAYLEQIEEHFSIRGMNIIMWLKKAKDPVISGFSRNPEYHLFFQMLNERHNFRFAYELESHVGKGVFRNVYKYHKGRIVPAESEFVADVIYQFSRIGALEHDFGNTKILNTPEFKTWGGDKAKQHELLKNFLPKTYEVGSIEELKLKAAEMGGPVILKPRNGQKGENVIYWDLKTSLDEKSIDKKRLASPGYLVQEFVDTSCGISNVTPGVHDVKLITIGGSIFANLRVPEKPDSYICTFDSEYTELKLEDLPSVILDFHAAVKKVIGEKYPGQIYTVDLGMTRSGPRLFEINTHTAFPYIHFEYANTFLETFIRHLEEYARKK